MRTYIALLRGVNVGGQKKMPMAQLRDLLKKTGFENVKTYIQSGNIIFQSYEEDIQKLEHQIQSAIQKYFGFEVPVLVKTPTNFQNILKDCPFPQEQKVNSYFVLLFYAPVREKVEEIKSLAYPNESFFITSHCVYLYCATGYGKAKLNNNFFERKLDTLATTRNYKTMVKLLALATN